MWQELLLDWYQENRRELPWRKTANPYHIWISEIMLQQTRVESVKGYFERFIACFPDIESLATAPQQDVLKQWEGLGYYSRARNLHKAAREILETYRGIFPEDFQQILKLPGIGLYTAGAIASIAFGQPIPAIDGNVYRVASRLYGIREPVERPSVQRRIRELITEAIPQNSPGQFNQALMELGATLCVPVSPRCDGCPVRAFCDAQAAGDAELLPIHEKKAPPKELKMGVALLFWKDRLLVSRREERLLKGLYVMVLLEDTENCKDAGRMLSREGLYTGELSWIGEARHVFTHRVWNMSLFYGQLTEEPSAWMKRNPGARLVNRSEMELLPIPTAMKAAKQAANKIFNSMEKS